MSELEGMAGGMDLGPLDLSDADTTAFEAIEPGSFSAEVAKVTIEHTKNEGKMPVGTPMVNFAFRITEEGDSKNRWFFRRYVIPPAGYDEAKARKMKGMLVRTLEALGIDKDALMSGSYQLDTDDLEDRECVIRLSKVPRRDQSGNVVEGEYTNEVVAIKPAGSPTGATETANLI